MLSGIDYFVVIAYITGIMLLGMFWKRAPEWGGLSGLIIGIGFARVLSTFNGVFFTIEDPFLYVSWWSFVAGFIITIVVSLFTKALLKKIKQEVNHAKLRLAGRHIYGRCKNDLPCDVCAYWSTYSLFRTRGHCCHEIYKYTNSDDDGPDCRSGTEHH